jgi:hypothetical protein
MFAYEYDIRKEYVFYNPKISKRIQIKESNNGRINITWKSGKRMTIGTLPVYTLLLYSLKNS